MTLDLETRARRRTRKEEAEPTVEAPRDAAFEFIPRTSLIRHDDAEIVGQALLSLNAEHGGLRVEDVVDAARADTSPLHRYFQWDDTVAAEAHRRWQARRLIKAISIQPVTNGIKPVHAFYNIPDAKEGHIYRPLDEIFAETARVEYVIRRFRADLKRIRDQYLAFRGVSEFLGYEAIFDAIDEVLNASDGG